MLTKLKGVNHVCQLYYVLEDASNYYVVQVCSCLWDEA